MNVKGNATGDIAKTRVGGGYGMVWYGMGVTCSVPSSYRGPPPLTKAPWPQALCCASCAGERARARGRAGAEEGVWREKGSGEEKGSLERPSPPRPEAAPPTPPLPPLLLLGADGGTGGSGRRRLLLLL